jgi:hypothetical protein
MLWCSAALLAPLLHAAYRFAGGNVDAGRAPPAMLTNHRCRLNLLSRLIFRPYAHDALHHAIRVMISSQ